MPDILLQLLPAIAPALLYAVLGFYFWHSRWRNAPSSEKAMQPWEQQAIGLALLLHGADIYTDMFSSGGMRFSFSIALSLITWLAVLIYLIESGKSRLESLQPVIMALASLSTLATVLFSQTHLIAHTASWAFRLHFMAGMLAYSLFTLAALHAVFMGLAERSLHHARLDGRLSRLPPLLAMEALLFRTIALGFICLTVALGSGVVFSEDIFGRPFPFGHKTIFALLSWLIFAALLLGRKLRGWRGRIALRWTLAGFLALLLAYIGSRFVSEVLLGRI
ncbi:MAG: cytochrome c biogenesis protein CcsA [Propionivibrio sp.]